MRCVPSCFLFEASDASRWICTKIRIYGLHSGELPGMCTVHRRAGNDSEEVSSLDTLAVCRFAGGLLWVTASWRRSHLANWGDGGLPLQQTDNLDGNGLALQKIGLVVESSTHRSITASTTSQLGSASAQRATKRTRE